MQKMGKEKLEESILQLANGDEGRSATARLADIIDVVEEALSRGVKCQAIIEELKAAGLTFTINSFDTARRRIKRRRASSPKQAQKDKSIPQRQGTAPLSAADKKTPGEVKKFVFNSTLKDDDDVF